VIGVVPLLLLQLAVIAVAGTMGIWLFYVQHQFEDAYWKHSGDWDYVEAAVRGSTFLRLPRWLQWFTGNIGYHHVHHLSARIPNYALQRCHESHPLFREAPTLTLGASLKTFGLSLFDEASQKLIGFRDLARLRRSGAATAPANAA
jgi:acyl-lipid omega-6 desaturase (Delta-12 desaturase)